MKEKALSYDHVPPKSCGNNKESYYRSFTPEYLEEASKLRDMHSQNGIKLRTICNKCNNDLGAIFDVELEKFYKNSLSQLNNKRVFNPFDLTKVVKAVVGHFLASAKPQNTTPDNDMRKFYNSGNYETIRWLANKYSLFYLGHPYKDSIFILRNYVTAFLNSNQRQIKGLLSSMYFYPFAFILAENQSLQYGSDLLAFFRTNKTGLLSISLADWQELDGSRLPMTIIFLLLLQRQNSLLLRLNNCAV